MHPLSSNFSLTHFLVLTLWWGWALGQSLSVSGSMIWHTWLHQCSLVDESAQTCEHTHSYTHIGYIIIKSCLCLVLIISAFVFILLPVLLVFEPDCICYFMTHYGMAHGHALVHSVFNVCVYEQMVSQFQICGGIVFPEKDVARSRLHDDGLGNEDI